MSSLPRGSEELWNAACAKVNFWETLDEIEPGALARLSRLARERRWEVIFLTSRPETKGDTAQLQSHRWLAAHGFELPSVFVVHGSRGKIAASLQLDVLVDDRPENCLDIAIDSTARAILVWRGGEDTVPGSARQLGIGSVASICEASRHPANRSTCEQQGNGAGGPLQAVARPETSVAPSNSQGHRDRLTAAFDGRRDCVRPRHLQNRDFGTDFVSALDLPCRLTERIPESFRRLARGTPNALSGRGRTK